MSFNFNVNGTRSGLSGSGASSPSSGGGALYERLLKINVFEIKIGFNNKWILKVEFVLSIFNAKNRII